MGSRKKRVDWTERTKAENREALERWPVHVVLSLDRTRQLVTFHRAPPAPEYAFQKWMDERDAKLGEDYALVIVYIPPPYENAGMVVAFSDPDLAFEFKLRWV